MNKQAFDQFKQRARNVQLPDDVRDNVLSEMGAEKSRSPRRHSVTRRAVVGVGLGAIGTAAALLVASIVTRPSEGDPSGAAGNCWFALRAYAEGVEQDDGSLLAADDCFGGHYSWSGGEGGKHYLEPRIDFVIFDDIKSSDVPLSSFYSYYTYINYKY